MLLDRRCFEVGDVLLEDVLLGDVLWWRCFLGDVLLGDVVTEYVL